MKNYTSIPTRRETNGENLQRTILDRRKLCMRFGWRFNNVKYTTSSFSQVSHRKPLKTIKPGEHNMDSYIY